MTKEEFEKVCSAIGLSISSAISSFINKVVNVGGIPYSLTTKNQKGHLASRMGNIILIMINLINLMKIS